MHGLSVCERLRQFRKLFALLVLEIYANYVDRWRGSDRTRESLAKAKTVCRGRKLHARNRLTAAVNDSTFKYIYIYFSLVLYRFFSIGEKKISFSSRMSKRSKKRTSFVGLHSLVRFFHTFFHSTFIHSRNYVIILSAPMLYVVSVFRTVNVYDLSRFIPYIFYIFSPFFYEEPDAQKKRYQSSFFESNPYSSLPHRRKYVVVTGSKRISHVSSSRRTLIPRSRRERERTAVYLFQNERASSNSRLWKTILLGLLA